MGVWVGLSLLLHADTEKEGKKEKGKKSFVCSVADKRGGGKEGTKGMNDHCLI